MCCKRELFTDGDGFLHRQRSLALDSLIKYNCEDAWNAASGWFSDTLARLSDSEIIPNWRCR